jgi:hypothetical protein
MRVIAVIAATLAVVSGLRVVGQTPIAPGDIRPAAPFGISRQDSNIDMTSRTQQRFGAPDTPERRGRDPSTLASTIPVESVPLLYLACGNQDIFVADSRRFVERLTARKIPSDSSPSTDRFGRCD